MKMFSLLEFVGMLPAIERDLEATGPMIIEKACQIIEKKAKSVIGTNNPSWPALQPATIASKAREGFKTPAPLLRTGEMRDLIQHTVHGNEGCVGSDDPVALWQELGTSKIPPRSFLVSSAIASIDRIERVAGAATVAALVGGGHGAHDLGELWHLLRGVGHEYSELAHDLMGDDDEGEDR